MRLIIAKPRGFCAGVDRAIRSVERALERYGPPVYVLNNIVHNAHVVEDLRTKGAVFVRSLDDVPEGAHLLFSAHGVGPDRWEHAERLRLRVIDATCPLVEKVHHEARRFAEKGFSVIMIGEPGHDETVGTVGWAPDHIHIIQKPADVDKLEVADSEKVAYITQTTLSVNDCQAVIDALRRRFPAIQGPVRADICYATASRQAAVLQFAPEADLVLVVGDPESANSTRLRDIARALGKPAELIPDADAIRTEWLVNVATVLITSGASVPERLVENVIAWFRQQGPCQVEENALTQEDTEFRLPKEIA